MSKNIVIQETGVENTLNDIKRVVTNRRQSGSDDWLNEDDVKLTAKLVFQRGTYTAADEGFYGYSAVVVAITDAGFAEDDDEMKEYVEITPAVTIKEGQLGKTFDGVKKLRIKESNGNYSLWIPEENVELDVKHICGNGVFYARNYGLYGWSKVVVTQDSDVITDPDDGNDYAHYKDKDGNYTGEVEKVPSSIQIITPPTVTTYSDGENISIDGIVVEAYYGDGTSWGTVPFDELDFEPKTAVYSEDVIIEDDGELREMFPSLYAKLNFPLHLYNSIRTKDNHGNDDEYGSASGDVYGFFEGLGIGHSFSVSFVGKSEYRVTHIEYDYDPPIINNYAVTNYRTVYGEKIYFGGGVDNYNNLIETNASSIGQKLSYDEIAQLGYYLFYGRRIAGGQTITVSWKRPEDSQILTDTYVVAVHESDGGSGGGSGGSSGGSW